MAYRVGGVNVCCVYCILYLTSNEMRHKFKMIIIIISFVIQDIRRSCTRDCRLCKTHRKHIESKIVIGLISRGNPSMILVYWHIGILAYWYIGIFAYLYIGTLAYLHILAYINI